MAKVTIYTTPTCGYCKAAKAFFKENDVAYEEKDVSTNEEYAKESVEKSGQMAVPVIEIDDTIVVGFDKAKLSQLLAIK